MNELVQARVLHKPEWGPRSLLEAGPGVLWPLAKQPGPSEDERWQVSCPGCGKIVYSLVAHPHLVTTVAGKQEIEAGYTFTGDAQRVETLSIAEEVDFVPCGCGRWRLTNGWWRHQSSATVILP